MFSPGGVVSAQKNPPRQRGKGSGLAAFRRRDMDGALVLDKLRDHHTAAALRSPVKNVEERKDSPGERQIYKKRFCPMESCELINKSQKFFVFLQYRC